jgi:hypothetical protein
MIMSLTADLVSEKRARLVAGLEKLKELRTAEPSGDPLAQERAAATHLTTTVGIARPLSDRYIAVVANVLKSGAQGSPEALFPEESLTAVCRLDDKFGAAFMVLPEHVDHILKGGKHMSRRFRKWGDVGDIFHVRGKAFRFVRIDRVRVGDITDDDIRKEGYSSREDFEAMWYKSHPKSVKAGKTLDPDQLCWCHEYEPL